MAWFAAEASRRGLRTTTRLVTRSYDGRGRYRARLSGWYVDRARTRAVDTDARFHLLTVPASLRARLFGADPKPSPRLHAEFLEVLQHPVRALPDDVAKDLIAGRLTGGARQHGQVRHPRGVGE